MRPNKIEGIELSIGEWVKFVNGPIWGAICFEIAERDKLIMERLRMGNDEYWSDEQMRGRLNELEYVLDIPKTMIAALKLCQPKEEEENDD